MTQKGYGKAYEKWAILRFSLRALSLEQLFGPKNRTNSFANKNKQPESKFFRAQCTLTWLWMCKIIWAKGGSSTVDELKLDYEYSYWVEPHQSDRLFYSSFYLYCLPPRKWHTLAC